MAMRLPLPTLIPESVSTQRLKKELLLVTASHAQSQVGMKWSDDLHGNMKTYTITEKINIHKTMK